MQGGYVFLLDRLENAFKEPEKPTFVSIDKNSTERIEEFVQYLQSNLFH